MLKKVFLTNSKMQKRNPQIYVISSVSSPFAPDRLSRHGTSYAKIIWVKLRFFFSSIILDICFGFSKEPSHRDGSFEYPQHMFWLRNKKNNFQLRTLIWRPASDQVCSVERVTGEIGNV